MRLLVRCLSIASVWRGCRGRRCGADQVDQAEQVDNPKYVSWAKYKPGKSVTFSRVEERVLRSGAPMKFVMTITTKLVEVKPYAVLLEITQEGEADVDPAPGVASGSAGED